MCWIVLSALGTTGPWAWSNIVFLRITLCCLALNQRCFTWYGNINSFNTIGLLAYETLQTNHSFTYFYSYQMTMYLGCKTTIRHNGLYMECTLINFTSALISTDRHPGTFIFGAAFKEHCKLSISSSLCKDEFASESKHHCWIPKYK